MNLYGFVGNGPITTNDFLGLRMLCDFRIEILYLTEEAVKQSDENKVLKYTNMALDLVVGENVGDGIYYHRTCHCEVSARDCCSEKWYSTTWHPFQTVAWVNAINMDSSFVDAIFHVQNQSKLEKWRKKWNGPKCKADCEEMVRKANSSNPCP